MSVKSEPGGTSRVRRVVALVGLVLVCVPVGLVLERCYRHFRGVEVCVHNVDSHRLRAGEVMVGGRGTVRSYPIGDLDPGETSCVRVKSEGEAGIEAVFTVPGGDQQVMPLCGYIEPGYSGSCSAEVAADGAREVHDDIDLF